MAGLVNDPVFQSYIVSVTLLSFNVLGLANATAITRNKASEVINPEDKRLNDKAKVVFDEGNDITSRYRRAHRNALENVPLFLINGLLLVMVGASLTVAASIFATFTVARILHSVCYVKAIQPFRTMFFAIATLAQLTLLGFVLYYVFMAG